jgi:hypothetical protein
VNDGFHASWSRACMSIFLYVSMSVCLYVCMNGTVILFAMITEQWHLVGTSLWKILLPPGETGMLGEGRIKVENEEWWR